MSSNALFQTITVLALLVHAGVWLGLRRPPYGLTCLLALNAVVAVIVLVYAAAKSRHMTASLDSAFRGLIVFELLAVAAAIWAFKDGTRFAVVGSYVAFGVHGCISLAAAVFAFAFKMTRLF